MIKLKDIIFPSISPTNEVIKLFESPVRIPQWVDDNLSNIGKNLAFTKKIRKDYKKIDNFKQFEIYKNTLGKFNYDYFIDGEYIKAFFAYQDQNNGKSFIEEKVWQDGLNIGLCREIVFDYYLKKYDRLISDMTHSDLGEKYWLRLVKESLAQGYKTFVLNTKTNEKIPVGVDDMKNYWSDNEETHFIYRFVIEKK
jgi:hypothetical protein